MSSEQNEPDRRYPPSRLTLWLVWFAYYTEQANAGIVEADSAAGACQMFWAEHGDGDHWPIHGVHALPAVPGQAVEIHAAH